MSQITDNAKITLTVNGKQVKQEMDDLRAKIDASTKAIDEMYTKFADPRKIKQAERELKEYKNRLAEMESATRGVGEAMEHLDSATPRQLQSALKTLNKQMRDMSPASEGYRQAAERVRQLRTRLEELREETSSQKSLWERFTNWINNSGAAVLALGMAINQGIDYLRSFVTEFAEMEEHEANAMKFTGFDAEGVRELNDEFKAMNTRTARDQLNELAAEAGRLGKSTKQDVLEYVKGADILNVALVDLGNDATQQIAKLANIFNIDAEFGTYDSMLKIGSAVNVLSQNCTASKPYLVEFTKRLAGVGNQAHICIQDIIGMGAVLDSNGQKVEASATAIAQVLTRMYREPEKYAKTVGLNVERFTKLLKEDANEALLQFLDKLGKAGNMDVLAPMFKDMGENGARAIQAMATLSKHIDEVRKQQKVSNEAFQEGTSVLREYNIFNNTTQAKLDKCKKAAEEMRIELGQHLLPIMTYLMKSTTALVKCLSIMIDFFTNHTTAAISLTSAIVSLTLAVKAKSVALMLSNGYHKAAIGLKALHTGATKALAVAQVALSGGIKQAWIAFKAFDLAMKASVIGAVIAAVVALGSAIYGLWSKMEDERQKALEAEEANKKFKRSLIDLSEESDKLSKKELATVESLYGMITNEYLARERRLAAAQKMKELYPDYFRDMETEKMLAGDAADAYERLKTSIKRVAEAKAAQKKYEENVENRVTYENERDRLSRVLQTQKDMLARLRKKMDEASKKYVKAKQEGNRKAIKEAKAELEEVSENIKLFEKAIEERQNLIDAYNRSIRKYDEAEMYLLQNYTNVHDITEPEVEEDEDKSGYKKGLSEKEIKKAKIKAKKEFKEAMEKTKAEWEKQSRFLTMEYSKGNLTYWEYLMKNHDNDLKYFKDREEVYKKFHLLDSEDYQELLKKKAEMNAKYFDDFNKMRVDQLEKEKKSEEKSVEMEYNNPKSKVFQDEEAKQIALYQIRVKYLRIERDLYTYESEQWRKIQNKIDELDDQERVRKRQNMAKKYQEWRAKYDHQSDYARFKQELAVLEEMYNQKKISEKKYQQWKEKLVRDYYKDKSNESQLVTYDKNDKADTFKVSGDIPEQVFSQMDEYEKKRDERIKEAKKLREKSIISEERYIEMVKEINADFYNSLGGMMDKFLDKGTAQIFKLGLAWKSMFKNLGEDGKISFEDIAEVAAQTFALVGSALETYTQFSKAQNEIQEAQIEKKYEAEIKAAQGNSYRVAALEKKKEKEISKLRKEAADQEFGIKIAMAIAQTAQNALMGYAAGLGFPPPANTFMPAILAGLATAQGVVQIALIKKQKEASDAKGYADGGYTGAGGKYEQAGIVHKGEWVASQKLLSNPVARPLIEALDYAQRNNTVASLKPEDVSRSIRATESVSRLAESDKSAVVVAAALAQNASVVAALTERLNSPFVTVNTVTGDKGIKAAQDQYNKLISNVTPKSYRK